MSEPWNLIRCLWTRAFQGRAEAFDNGVVVAVAREAHALRKAPREVLDMHDMHDRHDMNDVQMEHRDRFLGSRP